MARERARRTLTPQRRAILDRLAEDEVVVFFEPAALDAAILGVTVPPPSRVACVVYDYAQLVAVFCEQGLSADDAEEWVAVNTIGSWLGEATPVVVQRV